MNWTALIIISLCVCLIWELDERKVVKKHKKKQIEKKRDKNGDQYKKPRVYCSMFDIDCDNVDFQR